MTVVSTCGYGFSGSGAVYDFLQEYEELLVFPSGRRCEFAIAYEPDGLLDLEYNLVDTPAKHLRGDSAIYRFIQYTNFLSRSLNRETNGKFSELTQDYVKALVQVPYRCHRRGNFQNNAIARTGYKARMHLQLLLETALKRDVNIMPMDNRYIAVALDNFQDVTQSYVNDILGAAGMLENGKACLLDQAFPPQSPEMVFQFFENPYAIVVDRDPRDIYLTVKNLQFTAGRFIPHDTPQQFVAAFLAMRRGSGRNSERTLRLRFEDLIYKYEDTQNEIESFLGISEHVNQYMHFDPKLSKKNTQLFKAFPEDKDAIRYIEMQLPEYLYPFEEYEAPSDYRGIFYSAAWG